MSGKQQTGQQTGGVGSSSSYQSNRTTKCSRRFAVYIQTWTETFHKKSEVTFVFSFNNVSFINLYQNAQNSMKQKDEERKPDSNATTRERCKKKANSYTSILTKEFNKKYQKMWRAVARMCWRSQVFQLSLRSASASYSSSEIKQLTFRPSHCQKHRDVLPILEKSASSTASHSVIFLEQSQRPRRHETSRNPKDRLHWPGMCTRERNQLSSLYKHKTIDYTYLQTIK